MKSGLNGCRCTCHIVYENSDCRVPNVVGYETAEPLLPGSVPELQPNGPFLQVDVLRDEVDANGRSLDESGGT